MDDVGFEEWYLTAHPKLMSALTVIAGDVSAASDAVDEAFTRACERWGRVSTMDSPTGWTYQTARNALRRKHRRTLIEARLLRRTAPQGCVAAPVDWSPEMWDAISRLPERERIAVALRYVADLPTDEIADAMGVAPGTVGSTLHAARRNLGTLLSEAEAEAEADTYTDTRDAQREATGA